MTGANYFEFKGYSTHVTWYPAGKGGPLIAGGPPANAPLLVYRDSASHVSVWGDDLTVGEATRAGTFVVALVKRTGLPGADISFALLVPDVKIDASAVPVRTIGLLTKHREVSQIGPGQLEDYTGINLQGTAERIIMPV
jgi:hypothetical protein